MANLPLTLACGEYDRTEALIAGSVQPAGIDLTVVPLSDAWLRHERMIRHAAYDVAELSMSSYLMAKERQQKLIAIPVFPYRMFRHQFILIRRGRGIERPQDLAGKRVGTSMYQTTTMLWVRGLLQHEYGVAPASIQWVTDREELVPLRLPEVTIEVLTPPQTVESRFAQGDLDALVLIEEIPESLWEDPLTARLFPNFPAVEQDYWRRTGIFPMMHAVVMAEALAQRHPWAAMNLYDAFAASLSVSEARERHPRVVNLAWASAYFESERQLFGGHPYTYGIARNRASLDALVQYSYEQGLTRRRFSLEELFVPELMDT